MLWEVRCRLSGCVVLTIACGVWEIQDFITAIEKSKGCTMKTFLVRIEQGVLDVPIEVPILSE